MKIRSQLLFYLLFISISTFSQSQIDTTQVKPDEKKVQFTAYPAVYYSPETKFGFGFVGFLVIKDPKKQQSEYYRPTSISPYFLYTLNNQILTAFDIDYYFKNGMNLNTKIRYYNFPDFFYGLGNDTDPDVNEQYTNEYFRLDGRLLKPIDSKWFAGIRYYFQQNSLYDFDENGRLGHGDFIGEDGGWSNGLGLSFLMDTRNSTLYPTSGWMNRLEISVFGKYLGSDYDYVSYLLDLRKYWKIKNEKNVLAWQGYLNLTSGTNIPFYNLPRIGGDEKLRGIANASLYIDRQAWYTQVEYRRDLFWRFGAVLFAGIGDVGDTFADFELDKMKYVVGLGGRFQALKNERFNIRLDMGLARYGQTAFYLSVREAF